MLGPKKARHLDRSVLVSLEAYLPADNFYRQLQAKLDLNFVREWVADKYATGGRPSIDPVVFFKLQLLLFFEGLRSERKLMEVVVHLAPAAPVGFAGAPSAPAPGSNALLAYDAAQQVVVMYGGCCDSTGGFTDTWLWNGATWTDTTVPGAPVPQHPDSMVYDAARQVVVLETTGGETWLWDGVTWSQATPTDSPGPRHGAAMGYDAGQQTVLLYGGFSTNLAAPQQYHDTWLWNGTDWTPLPATDAAPAPGAAMVYDAHRGEVVLFGGVRSTHEVAETWTWDGMHWLQRQPAHAPSPRLGQAMTYDAARQVALLFGGTPGDDQSYGDLWQWNGDDWDEVTVQGPQPSDRSGAAMAYDGARQTVVLFGGRSQRLTAPPPTIDPLTWLWDGVAWSPVPGSTVPPFAVEDGPAEAKGVWRLGPQH
jgi:hypothetical protein